MALINCPECSREVSDKAGSCPHCGLPLQNTISEKPLNFSLSTLSKTICPSCSSDNTQTIKMMCLHGSSTGKSTGVGVTSDLDVGVGRMNNNAQTALAEKFTPGKDPAEIGGTLIGFGIGALILGAIMDSKLSLLASVTGWFCIVIGVIFIVASKEKKSKLERDSKIKLYEEGWICHKCGKAWILSEVNDDLNDKNVRSFNRNTENSPCQSVDRQNEKGSAAYSSKKTSKRALSVYIGLFVGFCSGTAIVSISEILFGFGGALSNVLIVIITLVAVVYSVKKENEPKHVVTMNTLNVIIFIVTVLCSFAYNFMDTNAHALLSEEPAMLKLSNGLYLSLLIGIPGYISLLWLFVANRKNSKSVDNAGVVCSKNSKLNVLLLIVYICIFITPVAGKTFYHQEPLTRYKIDKMGWTFVDGKTYVNAKSIKTAPSGNVTFEIAEADEFMVNQHLYEVNCNKHYYRHVDWVSHWSGTNDIVGRLVSNMPELFSTYGNSVLGKIISEVCRGGNNFAVFKNVSSTNATLTPVYNNRSSVTTQRIMKIANYDFALPIWWDSVNIVVPNELKTYDQIEDYVKKNYGADTGTKDTWKEALKVYAVACQRNNLLPVFLAHCYKRGEEYRRAGEIYSDMYRLASTQKDPDSLRAYLAFNAGEAFHLAKDVEKAAMWYGRSAEYLSDKKGSSDYYANQSFEKLRQIKRN